MKRPSVNRTSTLRLFFLMLILFPVVSAGALAEDETSYKLPLFRKVQIPSRLPSLPENTVLRLLADEDFPPFSFTARTGEPAGLAVELAMAACAEIKVKCTVALRPLTDLLPALAGGQGDLVLSGPRIDEHSLARALMTRPWFRSFGRFAAQVGSPLTAAGARSLAAKRIAVIKGTIHAAWLQTYYSDSEVVTFDTATLAQEALRTGNVEALFGDNLRLIYWIAGSSSHNCCKLLGGAISDFEAFSRNIAFLVRSDRADLRDAFDAALDRLQANGTTEKIFNVYVPLNPW
jgi:polar amino acid transport system substrate-binding protein